MPNGQMVWDWHVPDIHEINRARSWLLTFADKGKEAADAAYEKQYGQMKCWVKDEPDALMMAVQALWRLQNNCQRLSHEL